MPLPIIRNLQSQASAFEESYNILCSGSSHKTDEGKVFHFYERAQKLNVALEKGGLKDALAVYAAAKDDRAQLLVLRQSIVVIKRNDEGLRARLTEAERSLESLKTNMPMLRAELIRSILAWALVAEYATLGKADESKARLRQWASQSVFTCLRNLEHYGFVLLDFEYEELFSLLGRSALERTWFDRGLANFAQNGDNALVMLSRWFSGAFTEAKEKNPDQVLKDLESLPSFFNLTKEQGILKGSTDDKTWRLIAPESIKD